MSAPVDVEYVRISVHQGSHFLSEINFCLCEEAHSSNNQVARRYLKRLESFPLRFTRILQMSHASPILITALSASGDQRLACLQARIAEGIRLAEEGFMRGGGEEERGHA
jgi:hypothetical protein